VGPNHRVAEITRGMHFTIHDDHDYEDREISDEEFRELRQPSK